MKLDGENHLRIVGCRGDDELLIERSAAGVVTLLSDVEIFGAPLAKLPCRELKAGADPDTNAHRLEIIQALADGKRMELMVKRALTYRQPKGVRNRRGLRFNADKLDSIGPSFVGMPFLVNHNTYEQDARKGTILTSETAPDKRGAPAFFQGFSVVKPDAAISVLDGTIDRFSIGWFPTGAVICSVHKCDVTSKDSCYCWPLDAVEVDGETKIVEYEYQEAEGKELSAVNVPAVKGTKIEDYRAALTAELHLPPRRIKERTMAFTRLAAALALTALSDADEGPAVAAVEGLRQRALSAELDATTLRTQNAELAQRLAIAEAGAALAGAEATNRVIADAYAAGKLGYGKDAAGANTPDALESLLRDYGKSAGLDALKGKLTLMAARIPVAARPVSELVSAPPVVPAAGSGPVDNPYLASVAAQLALDPKDVQDFARTRGNGVGQ